jgi:predicted HAD superfamily phosphohydrolase YqeG
MNIPFENIGVVGDQIFTDVLGANRLKMYWILVEPISEKDIWVTRFNRKFERIIKKKISK